MRPALIQAQEANREFADLYGPALYPYVEMHANTTFEDIKKQVDTNNSIGFEHQLMVAGRPVIAFRKYTWTGRVAKTSYLHILEVTGFDRGYRVFRHWREQKNGTFKTI